MTILEPMIKLRPHLCYLFKLVSLIIDLYCRITQAAREAKNGPRKDFQCSIFFIFLLKRFTGDKEHVIVKKL